MTSNRQRDVLALGPRLESKTFSRSMLESSRSSTQAEAGETPGAGVRGGRCRRHCCRGAERIAEHGYPCFRPCDCVATTVVNGRVSAEFKLPNAGRYGINGRRRRHMIKNIGSGIEERHRRFRPMMPPGPGWAKPCWTGLDWTGLDWTGLDWTGGLRLLEACCSGATRRVVEQVTPCLGPCDYMATTVVNGCVCVFFQRWRIQ